jgi:hypothetical protein
MVIKLLIEKGAWQNLLGRKYVCSKAISQLKFESWDSHFWASLVAKQIHFFCYKSFIVMDGSEIYLEDSWLVNIPMWEQYPTL